MKRLALLLLALSCTPANAGVPDRPRVPELSILVAGDTAKVYASWTAGARATGYLVSSTASLTTGTWVGLPAAVATSARTFFFAATNTTADSADFIVCVNSTNSSGSSVAGCSAAKRWRRLPGAPVVTIDSVIALDIKPDAFGVTVTVGRQQLCPFARFRGDTVALLTRYASLSTCQEEERKLRLAGKKRPTPGQQLAADAICVQWRTTDPSGSVTREACDNGLGARAAPSVLRVSIR